jgi:hypothetical protein
MVLILTYLPARPRQGKYSILPIAQMSLVAVCGRLTCPIAIASKLLIWVKSGLQGVLRVDPGLYDDKLIMKQKDP